MCNFSGFLKFLPKQENQMKRWGVSVLGNHLRSKVSPSADSSLALSSMTTLTVGCKFFSVQLRQAQILFSSPRSVHAQCFETILINNSYIFWSSKGLICVLSTPKITCKIPTITIQWCMQIFQASLKCRIALV